jgi:hypothetical protein
MSARTAAAALRIALLFRVIGWGRTTAAEKEIDLSKKDRGSAPRGKLASVFSHSIQNTTTLPSAFSRRAADCPGASPRAIPSKQALRQLTLGAWLDSRNTCLLLPMFIPNQKVVCIDDNFPLGIEKLYNQLPVKDQIYVIRDVVPGQALSGAEGEVAVYLIGLNNPTNMVGVERGFNAERFAPLSYQEVDDAVAIEQGEEEFAPLDP